MKMSVAQALELMDRREAQPLPWPMCDFRTLVGVMDAALTVNGDDPSEYQVNPNLAAAIREWAGPAWECPICGDQNCEGFCDDDD